MPTSASRSHTDAHHPAGHGAGGVRRRDRARVRSGVVSCAVEPAWRRAGVSYRSEPYRVPGAL